MDSDRVDHGVDVGDGVADGVGPGATHYSGHLPGDGQWTHGPALHTLLVSAWQQEGQQQQRNWPRTKPQPHAWQYGDDQTSTIIVSLNSSGNTDDSSRGGGRTMPAASEVCWTMFVS